MHINVCNLAVYKLKVLASLLNGDPGVTRTPGLLLRRQSLYPLSYEAVIKLNNYII